MYEVRTRTCMPHTLKLIIHQEQIAGALPGTGVGNAQSAQQNSCWSYLLNAWYLCLYQGTDGTPSCLATWPANVFYIPPPFRGIHMFDLSNLFLTVVVFCCFYCTLNFVSPMTIGTWVLSMSRKCRKCFFMIFCGRKILMAPSSSDVSSWNFCSHEEALRIGVQSFWVIHRPRARHALSRISRTTDFSAVWVEIGADTGLARIV